jgi:hypothetical protein
VVRVRVVRSTESNPHAAQPARYRSLFVSTPDFVACVGALERASGGAGGVVVGSVVGFGK